MEHESTNGNSPASSRQIKQAAKSVQAQQLLIHELNRIVEDVQRSERTVLDLQAELAAANAKFPSPRTTREDVDFLTLLLKCANKKLVWEKNLASLQKRIPGAMAELTRQMNDPLCPPEAEMQAQMMTALGALRSAMERLKNLQVN